MITVLSLNPSMAKAASLPRIFLDAPNRIRLERTDLGGKGVNVARALTALGAACRLVGFDYEGQPVKKGLEDAGVAHYLTPLTGALRVNLKLKEEETGRTVEINEAGAAVTDADRTKIADTLKALCLPGEWVCLSGSLPPGAPKSAYADLCGLLKGLGCHVAVDCDGEPLRRAADAKPDLIKPNAQEFFALTGADSRDENAARAACDGLMGRGVSMICLSMGEAGARLYTKSGSYTCPAPPVRPLGVQGAGDTLLAGLLTALSRGDSAPDALRFASAAAGASVMRPGTLLCRMEDVEELLAKDW